MSSNFDSVINDLCPDHHYDAHILEWNTKNKKIITSFGNTHNDIPIHSELLQSQAMNQQNSTKPISNDKACFIVEEEQMNKIRTENADFVSKFIAYIISHQCPRNDSALFEILKIQKRNRNQYVDDWTPYFECIQQWIIQILYKTHLKNESSECVKQLIIFQYAPKDGIDDKTDIHPHQLQNEMDKLIISNDKGTIKLLNNLRQKEYHSFPNKVEELRKLLNKLQDITMDQHNVHQRDLPLFVHHFYPNYIKFSRELFQILTENIMHLEIPKDVISNIVEFAITVDNGMYYDCWYLQRNAKKCGNKLVELWDNLLFNKQHYTLTENNKYNGAVNNTWIPSQYLLKNRNDSLQNIINEICKNNILHIYRQITWSILLQINSLNDLYNHDIQHIGDKDDDWLNGHDHKYFYENKLGWKEWEEISFQYGPYTAMLQAMMYVFGGNIFNSLYAIQRIILVNEYDINVGLMEGIADIFAVKLDKRMKEIFPIIIPTEYQIIEALLNATDEAPLIYEYFYDASKFDPLLKCYLIELMLLHGMDALVLTFAAFITLKSDELLMVYTKFAEQEFDEELLIQLTKKLFAFKDVKSMSKLYIKYKKEIMDKYPDKIKLKKNPLIFPVEYRQNPPNQEDYKTN